jgi:predicted phosphodiesterase
MKIHILSDLHLEFGHWAPPATDADVTVLPGDIHTKGRAVAWALQQFDHPVIFVPGNHDYYGGSLGHTLEKMRAAARGTHVHVLQDEAVVIDGVRFLGGTLWTDYRLTGNEPLAQWDAQQVMNDFKKVRDDKFSRLRAATLAARHARTRAFFTAQLAEPFAGKTVVVSHHAPSELSIAECYRGQAGHLNAAYASRLEHLFGDHLDLWVHGHTHHSFDYRLYGTRVVCNPRGYAPEELNAQFNDRLVITG